ncbi:MAG: hypothetical protein QM692_05470 [Thermomicrobiales bacterium]
MPIIEYEPLRVPSNLDKRRRRVAVWAAPRGGGERLYLGDVWCSITSGEWRFADGPGYVRSDDAFATQDGAARALLAKRVRDAEVQLGNSLTQANAIRVIAGKSQLAVTEWSPALPHGAGQGVAHGARPAETAATLTTLPAGDARKGSSAASRRRVMLGR